MWLENYFIQYHKARLVAQGFNQQPDVDDDDTFSAVVKPTIIRVVLSVAMSVGWSVKQINIRNAFLHVFLSEEVFLHQALGFVHQQYPPPCLQAP